MKIKEIELIPLHIPQTYETHWANGQISIAEHTIVKIVAENGTYGVAEAVPRPGIYGETQESILACLRKRIIPKLIGLDSMDFEHIWQAMNETPYNFVAKGTVDVALYDLNGKLLGVPAASLLGGPYRKEVPLSWVSGGSWFPHDHIMAETKRIISEGYKAIKLKAGHYKQDVELAKEIRSIAPDDFSIYLDPNQLYTRDQLMEVGKELSGVISAIEEPVPAWADDVRLEFTRNFPAIALLSDESTFTIPDTYRQVKLGAIKRMAVKIPRTGYTLSAQQVHLAEMNHMPVQVSTQAETDLGCAACLTFASAFKQVSLPCEIAYYKKGMYPQSMLTEPLVIENGYMKLPEKPGIGVDVNWGVVNQYRVDI